MLSHTIEPILFTVQIYPKHKCINSKLLLNDYSRNNIHLREILSNIILLSYPLKYRNGNLTLNESVNRTIRHLHSTSSHFRNTIETEI